MREKVAIINSVYEYGSTGSLAKQLAEYGNANRYETYVFYGRGKKSDDVHAVRIDSPVEFYTHKVLTLLTGLQGYFSNLATRKLLRELERLEIRKVIFLNLHGYYLNEKRLFAFCREHHISIVYIMPDEYAGLGKCAYCNDCRQFMNGCGNCPQIREYPKSLFMDQSRRIFRMKQEAYKKQDIVLTGPRANIQHLMGSPLLKQIRMEELDWGIDLELYRFRENVALYDKYQIPKDKILILTVAKYSMTRKGVAEYFFGAARKLENSQLHFINVGYDGDLTEQEMPQNMTVIPYINNQEELAELYSMCDLYVLASVSDTQPLSALIALGCETPIACFYTSGLKYISNGDEDVVRYAKNVDLSSLTKVIAGTVKKNSDVRKKCRDLAEERYSKSAFNQKIFDLFRGSI